MANPIPVKHTGMYLKKLRTHTVKEWSVVINKSCSFVSTNILAADKAGHSNPIDFVIERSFTARKFTKPKIVDSNHQNLFNSFVFKKSKVL